MIFAFSIFIFELNKFLFNKKIEKIIKKILLIKILAKTDLVSFSSDKLTITR